MYSEWASVENEVLDITRCTSVLHHYPPSVGRDVAKSVVASLVASNSANKSNDPSNMKQQLVLDSEVKWTMEVICFGLSLTLTELETLKESVNVYLEWLSVLTLPKNNVPRPIMQNPLPYVRQMLKHLQNLFIPRNNGATTVQVNLCQSVLRAVQNIVQNSSLLDRVTWESLLMFVLNICDKLLAPPSQPNGLAEHLCELLMQTFMQLWLSACVHSFPTPPLWKTARSMFAGWRHHPSVVEYWCKITAALTARVVEIMHGPMYPRLKIPEEDNKYIPSDMNKEVMTQAWFRMLHMINNPVDLSNVNVISQSQRFFDVAINREGFLDPSQHPCLSMLPYIFLRAMRGVSTIVDAFLGTEELKRNEITYPSVLTRISNPETPTVVRKSAKGSGRKATSATSLSSKTSGSSINHKMNTSPGNLSGMTRSISSIDMHPHPASDRPQVNSILHLYGQWLFDAAVAGAKLDQGALNRERGGSQSRSRSSSAVYQSTISLVQSTAAASTAGGASQDTMALNPLFDSSEFPESYDAGRSEACGTLCRIFCCKKTGEYILPVYLSRFYLVVSHGLIGESNQVLASIILNSVNLFRIDLPGITCLLPAMLSALETILPDKELNQFKQYTNVTQLRRASIHLLLSLIPLPLHYDNLPIEDIQGLWYKEKSPDSEDSGSATSSLPSGRQTFRSLKLRIIHQLIGALQCETDPVNAQMILGGMLLALQDSALVEAAGQEKEKGSFESGKGAGRQNENEIVVADTAYGFFVQCIYLVSQRLDSWKSELSVSLAALELLSGLAKAKIQISNNDECGRAVRELCHYIVHQCERPPPHHKRELHSMIVAAFHTLTTWLLEHPYLLNDKNCLNEVLEIIELGISGSKSVPSRRGSNGAFGMTGLLVNEVTDDDKPVLKEEKDLNPASMRVLEAAEGVLACVFEHLGAFPSPCSPSSSCSLLNELSLVSHALQSVEGSSEKAQELIENLTFPEAVKHFRYFVVHNSVLLCVLEQNIGSEQEPIPTVTIIIRSASGRKVRAMQFRQSPRSEKKTEKSYLSRPPRPSPAEHPGVRHNVRHHTFPEEVDRIPLVKADCSIPLLSEVPNEEQAERLKKIQHLIEQQKQYDASVERRINESLVNNDNSSLTMQECQPPHPAREFQTARLLLSHLNLLTLGSVKQLPHQRLGPDLVMLNKLDPDFPSDLEDLDSIPVRNNDTVFIFYHKAGQTQKRQILDNVSRKDLDLRPEFTEFVLSLGWPVDLQTHPGWSGHTSTSWKLQKASENEQSEIDLNSQGPGIFNGDRYILYYADVTIEMAFIIPSSQHPPSPSMSDQFVMELENKERDGKKALSRSKLSLDLPTFQTGTGTNNIVESPNSPTGSLGGTKTKKLSAMRQGLQQLPDCRVVIVWTESYDGIGEFPLEELQAEISTGQETSAEISRKDMVIIFIHPLENGLFRIYVEGQSSTKSGMAIPLVSGSVVSRRSLGHAVRMTVANMCHRRRLDSDAYSPPHIKRKHRINELLSRYQRRCTEPDFFTAVFTDQHNPRLPASLRERNGGNKRPLSVA